MSCESTKLLAGSTGVEGTSHDDGNGGVRLVWLVGADVGDDGGRGNEQQ